MKGTVLINLSCYFVIDDPFVLPRLFHKRLDLQTGLRPLRNKLRDEASAYRSHNVGEIAINYALNRILQRFYDTI